MCCCQQSVFQKVSTLSPPRGLAGAPPIDASPSQDCLLKALLSHQFSIEISACSSLVYSNLYFLSHHVSIQNAICSL